VKSAGRCLSLGQPAFVEPAGGGRYRQPGDEFALVVVDAGGHAAHAQFQFFVVLRVMHWRTLASSRSSVGNWVMLLLGLAMQPGAGGIGADALRVVCGQEQLADRGQVQRRAPADGTHHLHARAFAVGALDIDDLVALAHAQVDRLLDVSLCSSRIGPNAASRTLSRSLTRLPSSSRRMPSR
jgi:hypothetical protein